MGRCQQLQRKIDLNYRPGPPSRLRWCFVCTRFVASPIQDHRCRVMGLGRSAEFRIRPDHTCDAYERSLEEEARIAWVVNYIIGGVM